VHRGDGARHRRRACGAPRAHPVSALRPPGDDADQRAAARGGRRVRELAEETARLGGLTYQLQWTLDLRAGLATLRGDPEERRQLTAECLPLCEHLRRDDLFRHTGLCNLAALGAEEDPERSIGEMVQAAGPELERLDPTWSTSQLLVQHPATD